MFTKNYVCVCVWFLMIGKLKDVENDYNLSLYILSKMFVGGGGGIVRTRLGHVDDKVGCGYLT
jgi:hypothetical protein